MPDEKRKDDEEIQGILSDLDSILSETPAALNPASAPPPTPPPPTPPPAAAPPPAPPPVAKTPEPPKPVAPPPPPPAMKIELAPPGAQPPKPAAAPAPAAVPPKIELSMPAPAAPPKPAAAPPPAPAPKPVEPPKSAPPPPPPKPAPSPAAAGAASTGPGLGPAAPLGDEPLPDKTPKGQIRRVAYLYLDKFEKERDAFAAFLMTTAQTVSKKPLFLRKVLFQPVGDQTDVTALTGRILETKAVAVMGILDGLSEAKLKDVTEAMSNAGLMFRLIPPAEVQKRAVAVDIIVDMMLLSPEE